ncbi:alpha/beta fold hydrolase [Guptibacillus algicola]|uniref:alpha/beta fold hydrolase n=1 Tax=Guptibacillus algicola TaxID=225844 RepID=UPI001CD50E88|nr:alpha/beta hydrolase [Alkalihalobacillus algicola]MCA0986011.1 alpha/beta hydrolase [Alkalihalobacillus algicola]
MRWEAMNLETSRGSFEVFTKGVGPPLCVAHLYSEFNKSGDYFAESFTDHHRVYLVNLKGTGNSVDAVDPHEYFMLDTVFDLEAIRTQLGYKEWSFAGHSTGGMLGCVYGIHASEGLKRLIIVGAAAREYASSSRYCIYHYENPKFEVMQNYIEQLKDPDLSSDERQKISKERTKLSLYDPERYDEHFSKNIHKTLSGVRMNFFAREIMNFDVTRQLNNVSVPTLIVCGEQDVQCPLSFSEEMAGYIPNSKLVVFHYSNHYPFLEEQSKFNIVTQEFLD